VNERWSQVEASLQRRLDLVPQLVASVKGYAEHERGTLEAVTQARMRAQGALGQAGGASPAAVAESQQALGEALRGLHVLVERYPDLEASGNFAALQDQLEGTENRLAVERQRYNEAVRGYNERLRVFPSALVARAFGFGPREYFESKRGAEDAVAVTF
jgi:LemA protein